MIAKLQLAVLPEASVALQVTVLVPTGKPEPETTNSPFWFLQTVVTPGQLSLALTVKLTGALVAMGHAAAAATLMSPGQIILGACVSWTVTVNEQPDSAPPVQVMMGEGDGWVRGYEALTGKKLWEFDLNPKDSVWPKTRNEVISTPVIWENRSRRGDSHQPHVHIFQDHGFGVE